MKEDNYKRIVIDKKRIYVIDNNTKYPSITTILSSTKNEKNKKIIKTWRGNESKHKEITQYSATLGTLNHWKSQKYLANIWNIPIPKFELDNNGRSSIKQWNLIFPYNVKQKYTGLIPDSNYLLYLFKEWVDEYNPKPPIKANGKPMNIYPFEKIVWSNLYGNAGSIDLLCYLDCYECNNIIDIKSNDHIREDYYTQTSAYKMNLNERYPKIDFPMTAILNLSLKKSKAIFRHIEYNPNNWLERVKKFYISNNLKILDNIKERVLKNLENIVI